MDEGFTAPRADTSRYMDCCDDPLPWLAGEASYGDFRATVYRCGRCEEWHTLAFTGRRDWPFGCPWTQALSRRLLALRIEAAARAFGAG
jgi:hypothetical protein